MQRWLKWSKYLPGLGWEPVVLTVNPGHATYPQRDESLLVEVPPSLEVVRTKSIEPLRLYGKIAGSDRVPYGGFSNEKPSSWAARFVRGNFFIPDARRGWNGYAITAARKLLNDHDISLVLTTGPPHSTHLIGLELQARQKVKWVADMRDPWTEVYYNYDMPRSALAQRYDRTLERKVLKKADAVIAASPGFAEQFANRVQRTYHVITNGYDELLAPVAKPAGSPLYITYTGTMASSYKPEGLLAALAKMDPSRFRLRVAGSLSDEVLRAIEEAGLGDNLDYLGYLPHAVLLEELRAADILLLLNPDVKGGRHIIPGKLFEYMSTQRPILAVVPDGSAVGAILSETGAGSAFGHQDVAGMEGFLQKQLEGAGVNVDADALKRYRRAELGEGVVRVFNGIDASKNAVT